MHRDRPEAQIRKKIRLDGEAGQRGMSTKISDEALDEEETLVKWLPVHLILERLPVRKLCQLRCVCKAWNAMLGGVRGAQEVVDTSEEFWFVMVRPPRYGLDNWDFRAYSSRSLGQTMEQRPFFRPSLSNSSHGKLFSLLGGTDCSLLAYKCKDLCGLPFYIPYLFLCSAGGLLSAIVCRPGVDKCYDIIVFNCVTGFVKVLPPPLDPGRLFCGYAHTLSYCNLDMRLDSEDPCCYYIMLAPHFEPGYLEIFESRSGCWKVGRDFISTYFPSQSGLVADGDFGYELPLRDFVRTNSSSHLKVADADFWWLVSLGHDMTSQCLLAYHVKHDAWSGLLVPSDLDVNIEILAKFRGRLLGAAPLYGKNRVGFGFQVWELQLTSLEAGTWVEVARTPEHLWPPLKTSTWQSDLHSDGSTFWMSFYKSRRGRSFRPPLVFDIAHKSWYSLPVERSTRKFGCIFVHQPRLGARLSLSEEEDTGFTKSSPLLGGHSALSSSLKNRCSEVLQTFSSIKQVHQSRYGMMCPYVNL